MPYTSEFGDITFRRINGPLKEPPENWCVILNCEIWVTETTGDPDAVMLRVNAWDANRPSWQQL